MADPQNKPARRIKGGIPLAILAALAATHAVREEGVVLRTYPDPVWGWKLPTACAGETGPHIQPGMTFTLEQCLDMLDARLGPKWEGFAERCLERDVEMHEALALLSMVDNIGERKICNSSMVRWHNAGRPASEWCPRIELYTWANGVNCKLEAHRSRCGGLVSRRARERAMCEGRTADALALPAVTP